MQWSVSWDPAQVKMKFALEDPMFDQLFGRAVTERGDVFFTVPMAERMQYLRSVESHRGLAGLSHEAPEGHDPVLAPGPSRRLHGYQALARQEKHSRARRSSLPTSNIIRSS